MCNLNIFINTDKTDLSFLSFLDSATKNSYLGNPDGDGVYFSDENIIIKTSDRLNYLKFEDNIKNSKFILSHQRIATSGKTAKYLQPFDDKEFTLLHNGILSDYVGDGHSDTYNLFREFLRVFNSDKTTAREKKIIKAIKSVLDENTGSFSICLFDKITQNLYYFKNSRSSIYGFRSEDKKSLYLTTINDNEEFLKLYNSNYNPFQIRDNKIYRISARAKTNIKIVGEIKPYFYPSMNNFKVKKKTAVLRERYGFESCGGDYGRCNQCYNPTGNFNQYGYSVCDDCLREYDIERKEIENGGRNKKNLSQYV